MTARHPSPELVGLVAAVAPLWAAEAEVCRTYFESPNRTPESDAAWLTMQAAKELVDGVVVRAEQLGHLLAAGAGGRDTSVLTQTTEELHEEAVHYAAFAAAHDAVRPPSTPPLSGETVGHAVAWPENVALRDLRAQHRHEHGRIGELASVVTEGGYCTLFAAGLARAGLGAADDAIATACGLVLDDEYDHMLAGIAGLADADLGAGEWKLLEELTTEQSRLRIRMRDAQFGHPVGERRMAELLAGAADPIAFDWPRAGFVPPGDGS